MIQFNYILMSQKDFLKNEVLEEILRERANYYHSQNKPVDFWITISPRFINYDNIIDKIKETNFYKLKLNDIQVSGFKNLFLISIVSTNKEFIKWIELRYGYFETLEHDKLKSLRDNSNLVFKSDGVTGLIDSINANPLILDYLFKSYPLSLHPDLLLNKFTSLLSSVEKRQDLKIS